MADSVRPPLGAAVYEDIAVEQHEVNERYWPLLKALAGPSLLAFHGGPQPPKQPIRLFKALGDYACALFDVEAERYPGDPQFPSWITNLVQRTEAMVMDNLDQMERPTIFNAVSRGDFTYHATKDQMRNAVRKALSEHARGYPKAAATTLNARLQPQKTSPPQINKFEELKRRSPASDLATKRKAFVTPILEAKGWSILDWAAESKLAYHTAANYLEGETRPYRSTRLKLATSLDVSVDQLPK